MSLSMMPAIASMTSVHGRAAFLLYLLCFQPVVVLGRRDFSEVLVQQAEYGKASNVLAIEEKNGKPKAELANKKSKEGNELAIEEENGEPKPVLVETKSKTTHAAAILEENGHLKAEIVAIQNGKAKPALEVGDDLLCTMKGGLIFTNGGRSKLKSGCNGLKKKRCPDTCEMRETLSESQFNWQKVQDALDVQAEVAKTKPDVQDGDVQAEVAKTKPDVHHGSVTSTCKTDCEEIVETHFMKVYKPICLLSNLPAEHKSKKIPGLRILARMLEYDEQMAEMGIKFDDDGGKHPSSERGDACDDDHLRKISRFDPLNNSKEYSCTDKDKKIQGIKASTLNGVLAEEVDPFSYGISCVAQCRDPEGSFSGRDMSAPQVYVKP